MTTKKTTQHKDKATATGTTSATAATGELQFHISPERLRTVD
jgi:hypothetical protein